MKLRVPQRIAGECGSNEVTVNAFDFGICSQARYHDAGERFRCRACGASGDAADSGETDGSFLRRTGGGWQGRAISLATGPKMGAHTFRRANIA